MRAIQSPISEAADLQDVVSEDPRLSNKSADLMVRWAEQIPAPGLIKSPHISDGSALNAMLLSQAAVISNNHSYLRSAADHLTHAAILHDSAPLNSSLYSGITGFGWVVSTFQEPHLLPWRNDVLNDLDDLLANVLCDKYNFNIDIVNGLAGVITYAISRGRQTANSERLWTVLEDLLFSYLKNWCACSKSNAEMKGSAANLGVAHGAPGLFCVAAKALTSGFLSERCLPLLKVAFDYLWQLRLSVEDEIYFPYSVNQPNAARLAWCYGLLGLACAYKNAIPLCASNRERMELLCKSSILQYRSESHGIVDSSLCHGHAGVAFFFCQFSGYECLNQSVRRALKASGEVAYGKTLSLEEIFEGQSSFLHVTDRGAQRSSSFLEGGGGIALALSSTISPQALTWSNLLGYYDN